MAEPPAFFALDPDEYHAKDAGRLPDGRQFFLSTPFVPQRGDNPGSEFLALYLFDAHGQLLEARIEDFGPRPHVDHKKRAALARAWLHSLGPTLSERLILAPFAIERFGIQFGFVPRPPDGPEGSWWVTAEPGDFMAFTEPWDSGEYDT